MRRVMACLVCLALGGAGGFWLGARRALATPGVPSTTVSANNNSAPFEATPAPQQSKTPALDLSIADGGLYRVRKAIDGDSIILENGLRVCYFGVHAPETGHYVKDPAPLAIESLQRNAELVEGKQVRLLLAKDPFDIHGRVQARVMLPAGAAGAEESDVGTQLVREGLARAFGMGLSSSEYHAIKSIEEAAKSSKSGIWGLEDKLRKETKSGMPYCSSGSSTLYHLATCPIAQRIRPENKHEYATIQDAEEAGKNPCRRCVPR